jgi:hypothetical protein
MPVTEGFVCWTQPIGTVGPCQYITNRLGCIDIAARAGSITKPADADIAQGNPLGTYDGINAFIFTVCPQVPAIPTTTTTVSPITLTLTASCIGSGINGTGRIVANGFSGGTGTYANVKIGNSLSNAAAATPVVLSGATSYTWNNLVNSTWFVILTDNLGNSNYAQVTVNCTNTTTTTSTTTTTTAAPICTFNGGSAVVVYPTTTTTTSTTSTTTGAPTSTTTSTSTTTTTEPPTTTTTTTGAPSATIQWDFEEVGGADGTMYLYVNGSVVETRTSTSNGLYTVYEGDTINVEVSCNTCFSPDVCATAESQSNKSVLVASDTVNSGAASIFTSVYTVVSGDIGNNINLSTFAICSSTCL